MAADLESWMSQLADKLREDVSVEIAAGDKLVGNVIELLITIDGAHCEIIAVRSKRKHAHVAVLAERQDAARRLGELLGFAYRAISRFRNAERKLVHRIERCTKSLVAGWTKQMDAFPAEPLARMGEAFPDARAMCGRGYHVHVPGEDDAHEKHRYDPLYAVSVPAGERRRALVYKPQTRQFVAPAALAKLLPPAAVAAGVHVADERETMGDIALEATGEVCCELPEFLHVLPDLGSCVPDCGSFDMPDCDIGGCDL
ncbi:MAG: hypothetical protein M4D80_14345 [Myxococcota bacterium]|nr:hypothetical protein [Myxococcota bacterium]